MHRSTESAGPLKDRAGGFWAEHAAVSVDGAGYLVGEWPRALAWHRLAGEWAFVQNVLERERIARDRCLDAGCGPGLWLEKLSGVFAAADGFDGAVGMVDMSRNRLQSAGITNAWVNQADLHSFHSEHRYDFIFVGGVLTYLEDEDVKVAVKRLAGLLKTDGAILFRESTYRGFTRRRTEPLNPGLFADPKQERPPYFAIYRQPNEMSALLEQTGLRVAWRRPNHHYKLADFTEEALRVINRVSGGALATDPARAERCAELIHRYRHVGIVPLYHLLRLLPLWQMQNHWFLCRTP